MLKIMPRERVELSWGCPQRLLRPPRLPFRHLGELSSLYGLFRMGATPAQRFIDKSSLTVYSRRMSRSYKFHPAAARVEATRLRREGFSLSELSAHLQVPKATIQGWMRSIPLSNQSKKRIRSRIVEAGKIGRPLAVIANRQKIEAWKQRIKENSRKAVGRIQLTPGLGRLLCSVLYVCEGSKYPSARQLGFGNSDPRMIQFFLYLLRTCFAIDERKFRCQVMHRWDQSLSSLIYYWSRVTRIPTRQFYPTQPDKRTKGKRTLKKDYRGVCLIQYLDTTLQFTLQSIGEALMEEYGQERSGGAGGDRTHEPPRCHRGALPS